MESDYRREDQRCYEITRVKHWTNDVQKTCKYLVYSARRFSFWNHLMLAGHSNFLHQTLEMTHTIEDSMRHGLLVSSNYNYMILESHYQAARARFMCVLWGMITD